MTPAEAGEDLLHQVADERTALTVASFGNIRQSCLRLRLRQRGVCAFWPWCW